jgi:hypothetical protein
MLACISGLAGVEKNTERDRIRQRRREGERAARGRSGTAPVQGSDSLIFHQEVSSSGHAREKVHGSSDLHSHKP